MDRVTQPPDTRTTGQSLSQDSGYVIVSEIGRGGMGIVYRAHDLKLGRMVALKRPKPEVMALPDFTRRFLREARTASKLLHPNITTVFAAYEDDGVPWLVMELVEGVSLRDRLARGGSLPVGEVIEHAEGLADALRAAHEQGILHSDVNPNNILIGRDGRARLTDFGLARARNVPGEAPVFGDGEAPAWSAPEAAGTRGYMAPEHLRGRGLDPRRDLYCLGLVLFEMCAGSAVFAGKSTVEWVGAAMDGETERLTRLGPEVPPELRRIIAKATATEPRRRYQSAAAMVADLRALRRYRESGVEIAVADAARARERTHYGVLAAAVVVTMAGIVALITWKPGKSPVLRSRPLTSAPGLEEHPALSPDGRLVAYSSNETGNADIWVMDIETREAVRLTDDIADETSPAWFPDGSALVYVSARDSEPSVWRVAAAGGTAALLLTSAEDPAVSPDGTRIAFAGRDAAGILRIAVTPLADVGARTILTGPDTGFWDHHHPAWSADGRSISFQDHRDLWIVPSQGGTVRPLTTDHAFNQEPTWSADGRFVYFSSQRDGPRALWRIAPTKDAPERLTQGMGPESAPSLSRDGHLLAYATRRGDSDVEVRDIASTRSWRIASSALDVNPALDPLGRSVVFTSARLGTFDLWFQPFGSAGPAGPPHRLTSLPGTVAEPAFSPDGQWVAFHRAVGGKRTIWIMPATGGTPRLLVEGASVAMHPAFSPDGSRVAFVADRAGRPHVWVARFRDGKLLGEPTPVTHGNVSDLDPSWAPDGRQIAFVRQRDEDSDAWIVGLEPDEEPKPLTHGVRVEALIWAPSGDSVLVAALWDRRFMEVRAVSPKGGGVHALVPAAVLGGPAAASGLSLSADGRLVAYHVETTAGDIWVAELIPGAR